MVKTIGPFMYVGFVYLIMSISGFLLHFHDGFFFETALWEIFKVLSRDIILWSVLFTIVSMYAILLYAVIFNKKVTL